MAPRARLLEPTADLARRSLAGLQRSRFPAVIHTGVTAPLEQLLVFLSSTYGSQLARNKFSGRRAGKADRSTSTPAQSPGLVAPFSPS
jgi:hypothetical protein